MDVRFYRSWKPLQWISAAAVALAVLDTFVVSISLTALGFLIIAALPWFIHLFRTIELPWGVKIEMRELEKVSDKLAEAGAVFSETSDKPKTNIEVVTEDRDPNLALAALRIEIERKLRALLLNHGIEPNMPLREMLNVAANKKYIDREISSTIRDLMPTLNAAVHGADVPQEAYDWVTSVGPALLNALGER
jgi:hypothetical protein